MGDCEFFLDCPFLRAFETDFLKGVWTNQYCRGPKCGVCAVRKSLLEGEPIPDGLMPNGDYMN